MKSFGMIIVFLTIVLILPLSVQAQPPGAPPPAGPIAELREQIQDLQDQIDNLTMIPVINVRTETGESAPGDVAYGLSARCLEGEILTGGGCTVDQTNLLDLGLSLFRTMPRLSIDQWTWVCNYRGDNIGSSDTFTVTAYAICME